MIAHLTLVRSPPPEPVRADLVRRCLALWRRWRWLTAGRPRLVPKAEPAPRPQYLRFGG